MQTTDLQTIALATKFAYENFVKTKDVQNFE